MLALDVQVITPGRSPRLGPVDPDHIRLLSLVLDEVPPILVHAETMTIVDGTHRWHAARMVGRDVIRATLMSGSAADVLVESVRRNIAHGRPLSLREREASAVNIMRACADLSDRAIAVTCGLSPTTVGRLRKLRTDSKASLRRGRDGRTRRVPDRSEEGRLGTVGSGSCDSECCRCTPSDTPLRPATGASLVQRRFQAWLARTAVCQDEVEKWVSVVPLCDLREVADQARLRARLWDGLAVGLDARAHQGHA